MANIQVVNPFQNFVGLNSVPVQNGYIYIGLENQDPESYPQAVYWDSALTIPAAQPIRTTGGYISNAGTPAQLFTANKYSMRVKDSTGALVFYQASSAFSGSYLALAGGAMSGAVDFAKGADIASNTLTDIGAATGNYVTITGTTTITAFGTAQAGTMRWLRFAGALTLTHNATSLILPDGVNISTVAGDVALFISEGAGNWRCGGYSRVTSTASVTGAYKKLTGSTTGTSSVVTLAADEIVVTDSNNVSRTLRSVSLSINLATSGANGLDTGSVAASTFYTNYVIYNPTTNTVAGLASLSATSPTLPSGYTFKAALWTIRTDATANKYPFSYVKNGPRTQLKLAAGSNTTGFPVIASGTAASLTAASLSSTAPQSAYTCRGFASTSTLSGNIQIGANANGPMFVWTNGSVSGSAFGSFQYEIQLETQNVYWAAAGGGGSVSVTGWDEAL